jgi:hypothetical protein
MCTEHTQQHDEAAMDKPDNVVTFPILSMEAMTPEVFVAGKLWEPAMSFPFPAKPSSKLLREARRQVLKYLDWITSDNGINSEGPEWATREIRRACVRLVEISEALPAILDAEFQADMKVSLEEEHVE